MKRALTILSAATALAFSSAVANADNLNFDTAGGFSGPDSSGGNLVFQDITGTAVSTVLFQGAPATDLSIPGTYNDVNFGNIVVTTTGTPGVESLSGDQLELVFIVNAPFTSSAPAFSTFESGLITTTAGGLLTLTFNPPANVVSFNGGQVTFTLKNEYDVTIDTSGTATFAVTGTVTTTAAPEPSTFALMGVAALGLLFPWLRRRLA